jgi:ribosomal protein S18 acetylase RimI-like enzyme
MEIRIANQSDLQGASAVQHAVISSDHPYEYARNILCGGTANLVATENDAIVGYISVLLDGLNPNGRYLWERLRPYLAFVGVLPDVQGQHVGTELIRRALQLSDPHATSGMWLECPESAAAFYEKVGFCRVTPDVVQQHSGMLPKGPVYRITSSQMVG